MNPKFPDLRGLLPIFRRALRNTRPAAIKGRIAVRTRAWASVIGGLAIGIPVTPGSSAPVVEVMAPGVGFFETFASPPAERGWRIAGDPALFTWDAERGALYVTWDSRRSNAFFYRPLGTVLTAADDFGLAFDLEPLAIAPGVDPAKPSTFQIAVGFLDLAAAQRTNYFRASGVHSETGARSVVEWNYFPDTGFGATVSPAVFATNNTAAIAFTFPVELRTGIRHRVAMSYSAAERRLHTTMWAEDAPTVPINDVELPADRTFDFRLDAMAVASYSDAGQSGAFAGSILAEGWVDNLEVQLPPPLTLGRIEWSEGVPVLAFVGRAGWRYVLERSVDLQQWVDLSQVVADAAGELTLRDDDPPESRALYRVRAELP